MDPILNAYGQWVIRDYDENGEYMGTMSHILRVFLIDESRQIRNIYSTSFLHADTVANDVRSLLMEATAEPSADTGSNRLTSHYPPAQGSSSCSCSAKHVFIHAPS